jgi:hypothetical protein
MTSSFVVVIGFFYPVVNIVDTKQTYLTSSTQTKSGGADWGSQVVVPAKAEIHWRRTE